MILRASVPLWPILVLGMALEATAVADVVTPPPGWTSTDSLDLAHGAAALGHFGATKAPARSAAAQITPNTPDAGVSLFVSRVAQKISNDPAAIRAEVDTFHGASHRAQLTGSTISEQGWQEKVDDKTRQVEATLAFADAANHLVLTSRLVIVATADELIAVTGECIARDDANAPALAACKAALLTLDPEAAPATRLALALAPAGTPPPEHDDPIGPRGPSMSDGSHIPLAPMVIHPDTQPTADRRPVFIGAGVVLLAVAFWWNMKRRKDEEEDED